MVALCAVALSTRLLVPAGFMPTQTPYGFFVKICDSGAPGGTSMFIAIPAADEDEHGAGHQPEAKSCAFAALSTPALFAEPAPVLAAPAQLLHELVLPPPATQTVTRDDFLHPPLRGPPARA